VLVDLGNCVGLVGGSLSAESEGESLSLDVLVVGVGVVEGAGGGFGEVEGEVALLAAAEAGLAVGELAGV